MSLLLDALKRAELAKREQMGRTEPAPAPAPALEPAGLPDEIASATGKTSAPGESRADMTLADIDPSPRTTGSTASGREASAAAPAASGLELAAPRPAEALSLALEPATPPAAPPAVPEPTTATHTSLSGALGTTGREELGLTPQAAPPQGSPSSDEAPKSAAGQASGHSQTSSDGKASSGASTPSHTAAPNTGTTAGDAATAPGKSAPTAKSTISSAKASASPPPTAPAPAGAAHSPAAARQVLAARQAPAKARISRPVVLGGLAVLVAAAVGGYIVWQTTQPAASTLMAAAPASGVVAPTPNAEPAAPADVASSAGTAAAPDTTTADPASSGQAPATALPPSLATASTTPTPVTETRTQAPAPGADKTVPAVKDPSPVDPVRRPPARAAATLTQGTPAADSSTGTTQASRSASGPISITRSSSSERIDPRVQAGYQALQSGRPDLAETHYQRALREDATNRDALLGLAAVAMKQGRAQVAAGYYQQLLQLDPKDELARTALSQWRSDQEPGQQEAYLKSQLDDSANTGAAAFALGNVYARERRWSEAQSAYFKAYAANPNHPDYAYNLAVSLDFLAQDKLAAEYYRKALTLSGGRAAAFDAAAARSRLNDIETGNR